MPNMGNTNIDRETAIQVLEVRTGGLPRLIGSAIELAAANTLHGQLSAQT